MTSFEDETKSAQIKLYCSPNLKRAIEALARLDRRDVSQWIRFVVEDEVRARSVELEA